MKIEDSNKVLEVAIREMEIDDIPHVFHLGEEIFTAQEAPTLYRTWDEYEVTSLFNSDNEYCLVAEHGGKIVGFALGSTVSKKRSAWKYGYLIWLGVSPDHRRCGIASCLFDKLAERMIEDGVRIFMVETEAKKGAAFKFFKNRGFRNPEKHIYLTLNLKIYQQLEKKKSMSRRKKNNGKNQD